MTVGSSLSSHQLAQPPSAWRDELAGLLGAVEIGCLDGEILSGELISRSLGPVRVSRTGGGPVLIRGTQRTTTREDPSCIHVWQLLHGRAVVYQDGRRADVTAGDLALCDTARPYELAFPGVHRAVLVRVPSESVWLRAGGTVVLTARSISGRHGAGALVAGLLTALAEQLEQLDQPEPSWSVHLSIAITAMLEAVFDEQVGQLRPLAPRSPQAALLVQIQAFVDRRLSDPDLSPEMISNVHNVSARYLQKLFRAHGQTVTGYIRGRRLEACRRDLVDPRLAHRPIGLVASSWGMTSPAYFSRAFKAAYGRSPRDLRADAAAGLCADGQAPGASGQDDRPDVV